MPADSPAPGSDFSNWVDLQAVLTEELECIRTGVATPANRGASERDSLERAQTKNEGIPDERFYTDQYGNSLWGLCLSGGGIRSATFALGILQGLAAVKLLPRFHYLSTVSGGGYIGSWLSSWSSRHPKGIDGVVEDLNKAVEGKKIEADPLWYLRSYTSYLNPRLGVLSTDTWTLASTYLRNLLLNWLVLVPLFWALVLSPKIGLALVRLLPGDGSLGDSLANCLIRHRLEAAEAALAVGCLGLLFGMEYIFTALAQKVSGSGAVRKGPSVIECIWQAVVQKLSGADTRPDASSNPLKARTQGEFIKFCLVPIMVAALTLPLAWAWYPGNAESKHRLLYWIPAIGVGLRALSISIAWFWAWWKKPNRKSPSPWELAHRDEIAVRYERRVKDRRKRRRNDVFHLFVAALATGALGGFLVRWLATTFFPDLNSVVAQPAEASPAGALTIASYVCFAPPLLLLAMLSTEGIFIGLVSRHTDDEDREWWSRAGGWLLIGSLFWMGLRILSVFGPLLIHWLEAQAPVMVSTLGGLSGIATALLGFSGGSPATTGRQQPRSLGGILRGSALVLSAGVFACALSAGLALAGDWVLHYLATGGADTGIDCSDTELEVWLSYCGKPAAALAQSSSLACVVLAIVALLSLAFFMQFFVSVNRFSLHAMYRARLIRAYLGASNTNRRPNWFTGFDPADNLNMADINAGGTKAPRPAGQDGARAPRYPFHILNTTLNLVHGDNLAWQQRKAASMTISPLHAGNRDLGYRRSRTYGHPTGISLGTALTISGAAASPNMGYHSSPIVGLVMTLFNVRLGAWLGNPGRPAGDKTYSDEGPDFSAVSLINEALGLTDNKAPYVYLSDGGHFENLGLYELVQRRCRLIVVSDAGRDPDFEFEDLGNAIRKIRIDLGVEIEMDRIEMHPRAAVDDHGVEPVEPGRYFATGTIRYPERIDVTKPASDDNKLVGRLIYIKPGIYGSEPRDVMNYAATHPDFPHESTADQWFDESQYESYRRLGRHVAMRLFGDLDENATFDQIVAAASPASQTLPPAVDAGGVRETLSFEERVADDGVARTVSVQETITTDTPSVPTSRAAGPAGPPPKIIHRRPPKRWFGGSR